MATSSPASLPPNTLLGGKFRLVKRIGRGGMGDVWVARNEATHAEVAVKTLVAKERSSANVERFRREARLAATISHRHVVRVYDLVDEPDGTLGLVMELLRGATLEDVLRERGRLTATQALAVALPILAALHHVHQRGIVHRDVKPANVFFAVEPDGHVIPKLLDFGIAKLPAASSALTVDGSVLGTPHYMSPEQIRANEEIDARSDLFSFAVVLHEMLTGAPVFARDTAAGSLAAVLEHDVDPEPHIDPRLWCVLARALSKRPYERYATASELEAALRAAAATTDDALAVALQELRPRFPIAEPAIESTSMALTNPHAVPPRRRGFRIFGPLLVAAGAAVAALVFHVVRPAAPPSPSGPAAVRSTAIATAAPSAVPVVGAAPVPTPAPSAMSAPTPSAMPAPEPPPAAPAAGAPRVVVPAAAPVVVAPRRPPVVPTATASVPPPPSAPVEPKPKGRGPVATTPGF